MLFDDFETQRMIEISRRAAGQLTGPDIAQLIRFAKRRKHPLFDIITATTFFLYKGRSKNLLETALREQFPETPIDEWPKGALNLMKMFARIDSGVYRAPADRWLLGPDGVRLEGDDARSELMREMIDESMLQSTMQEVERRSQIPPGLSLGEVRWSILPEGNTRPDIDLYWPDDAEVLAHWERSTSWDYKWFVAIRQAQPSPMMKGTTYKIYSRMPPTSLLGAWSPWFVQTVSIYGVPGGGRGIGVPGVGVVGGVGGLGAGGDEVEMSTPALYVGQLCPVFVVQPMKPDGYLFDLLDPDLTDQIMQLAVQRTDEAFTLGRQGHSQLWTDDPIAVRNMAIGPDKIAQVNPLRTLNVLTYQPALNDARESRRMRMREMSISRSNSPHAYDDMGSVPQTGVSKLIDNLAHDDRIAENQPILETLERRGPLAVLLDVVRTFHPRGRTLGGCQPHVKTKKAPAVEDQMQKQGRLTQAVNAGWISPARAAFEMGLYDTIEEAEVAIAELKPAPPPAPPPGPGPPAPPGPPVPPPPPPGGGNA